MFRIFAASLFLLSACTHVATVRHAMRPSLGLAVWEIPIGCHEVYAHYFETIDDKKLPAGSIRQDGTCIEGERDAHGGRLKFAGAECIGEVIRCDRPDPKQKPDFYMPW